MSETIKSAIKWMFSSRFNLFDVLVFIVLASIFGAFSIITIGVVFVFGAITSGLIEGFVNSKLDGE